MARAHVDIELRWGDQDAYGHINNVVYSRLLEEARTRIFWQGSGRERTGLDEHFRDEGPGGVMLLVANQQIEFLRVLEYGPAPVTIDVWIGKLGGSSIEIHYEVVDGSAPDRTIVARAISTIVFVDGRTMRPSRMSREAREALEAWSDEPIQMRRG